MSGQGVPALSLFLLLSALVAGTATGGEIYKWVDEKGTIHFSDRLEDIPHDLREKTKKIPVYEQNEVSPMDPRENAPRDRTVPNEEAIDRLLRRIWKEYRDCLKRGEIEKALTYIHPHNREKYREIFRILKDKMPAIVEGDIELVMEDIGEGVATYRLRRLEKNGERYAYSVTFAMDMGGNWKILDE